MDDIQAWEIALCRGSDEEAGIAFGQLSKAHQKDLEAFARYRSLDIPSSWEDLLQQASLKLWANRSSHNPSAGPWIAWAKAYIANEIRSARTKLFREQGRRVAANVDLVAGIDPADALSALELGELQRDFRDCFSKIDPDLLSIVLMRIQDGMTYEAISNICGCSISTAQTRFEQSLRSIRGCMARKGYTRQP